MARPGTAPCPFRSCADNGPRWVLSLTGSGEATGCLLPVSLGRGCLGIGELATVSGRGEMP